jgi:hypothetical protein
MDANHSAWRNGETETGLTMCGAPFRQKTFKYQASTFDELRRKFSTVADDPLLVALLRETDCLQFFTGARA